MNANEYNMIISIVAVGWKHKKRQAQRQQGHKKAPDPSIVGRCASRDEPALQLERSVSTQGQAGTVLLYSTSQTSPAPVMLPLSLVENSNANPSDHSLSLLQRGQRSAGCTNPNKLIQLQQLAELKMQSLMCVEAFALWTCLCVMRREENATELTYALQ